MALLGREVVWQLFKWVANGCDVPFFIGALLVSLELLAVPVTCSKVHGGFSLDGLDMLWIMRGLKRAYQRARPSG